MDAGRRPRRGRLSNAISTSVRAPLDREPGRSPGLESAGEIGRAGEAEILQRRGRQARLIALVADEDDVTIEIAAEGRVAMPGSRIDTPFEHIAGAATSAGDQPVALSLTVGTDVDEHRTLTRRIEGLPGRNPVKPPAGCRNEVVDSRATGIRQLALLAAPRGSAVSGRCRHPSTERGSTDPIGPQFGKSRMIHDGSDSSYEAGGTLPAQPVSPLFHVASHSAARISRAGRAWLARIVGFFHEPEEGLCPSYCSTALVDVDRRRRCRDSAPATLQATRGCATRPIRRRWRRSSPSCAPPVTARMAADCAV
jgi:hypothetical protein